MWAFSLIKIREKIKPKTITPFRGRLKMQAKH